jgi:acyl-CoA thioesterase-1
MKSLMRQTHLLLIIISVSLLSAGCGVSDSAGQFAGDPSKPLVLPKTAEAKPKIIAFGDSLTAGFGLSEDESYPYLLQKQLEADGYKYEVLNAGVSGDTSLGGLERIDWALSQENVEVLILALGGNDLLRRMPVDSMRENLASMIKKAKERDIKVLLCGMLAPPNVGPEYQMQFIATFPALAKEFDLAFMPFILKDVAFDPELNQSDGIHPNAEGAKVMMGNIYNQLRPLLRK